MNTATDTLQHYRNMASEYMNAGYDWLSRRRFDAAAQVQQLPLPEPRAESWRYTPLPPVLDHHFKAIGAEEDLLYDDDIRQLRLTGDNSPRIVLLNGFFLPGLSNLPADGSVEICSLRSALANNNPVAFEHLGQLSGRQPHLFNALNTAMMSEGAYLRIPAGRVLEQPIEVLHVTISFDSEYIAQPRLLVVLEEDAEATLIDNYTYLADTLCMNNVVSEIFLGKGAQLKHPRLQQESPRTRHLSSLYIRQAEGSRYQGTTLALGSAWSRTEFHADFSGSGAECELNGFYLSGEGQSHDMHLDVIHNLPGCNSRERFKGILHGHSKAVFDGNIVVEQDAQQTDARLSNDNLLLSRDAEIDTKPRLEIYADDVQCSHGTTVGQIDPEMLFYLRARGIPHDQAINMICTGFADEVIATCEWEALEARAREVLAGQLATVAKTMEP